jgi:hypothetical protein
MGGLAGAMLSSTGKLDNMLLARARIGRLAPRFSCT